MNATPRQISLWQNGIRNKVRINWLKPSGLPNEADLMVEVTVQVLPDGTLTNPRITTSSGNRAFDNSVIRAIHKTRNQGRPDPIPPGCWQCRAIRFTFRPEDG